MALQILWDKLWEPHVLCIMLAELLSKLLYPKFYFIHLFIKFLLCVRPLELIFSTIIISYSDVFEGLELKLFVQTSKGVHLGDLKGGISQCTLLYLDPKQHWLRSIILFTYIYYISLREAPIPWAVTYLSNSREENDAQFSLTSVSKSRNTIHTIRIIYICVYLHILYICHAI